MDKTPSGGSNPVTPATESDHSEQISLLMRRADIFLAVRAQQRNKLPTIGVLGADATVWRPWTDAFVERLRQLGWIDGSTIAIEYRCSEGRPERVAEIAAEFVRLKVDIILAPGSAVAALN